MVLANSLLLLAVVVAQRSAATAPNARPPTDQLREQHGAERVVPYFTALVKTLVWSWAVLEGSVLFALSGYCPPALARPLLHFLHLSTADTHRITALTTLTPTFLTGALLSIAGAALRLHCFRTLGSHFTFELSIRSSHALVTHGVYGIVRHPSYIGALALAVGWLLCVFDPQGSVVSVCTDWARVRMLASSTSGDGADTLKVVVTGAGAVTLALCVVLNKRMDKEDAMLEKYFGDEWRAWAKRVPYRLVPGVY